MYLFNFVQINNESVHTTHDVKITELQRNSYVIGSLLFGNLADNAFDPKAYLVLCSAFIGLYIILLGIYIETTVHEIEQVDENIGFATDSIMLFFAGIKAFSMVQLFNWFPSKYRGTVMALLNSMETFGFCSQFIGTTWW